MRAGVAILAIAAGLIASLVVAALTDPGVTICVDNSNGGSYCEPQGGPDLPLAVVAGVLTALLTGLLLELRERRR